MTPDQVQLVQESFAKVKPIAGVAADLFYDRLFAIAPGVRQLFPDDMAEQKAKLMAMLGTAVAGLNRPEVVAPAIAELGRRHVAYHVEEAHYRSVGEALLWTLEQGLGPDWTPELRVAWTDTYTLVAGLMKDAARTASDEARARPA